MNRKHEDPASQIKGASLPVARDKEDLPLIIPLVGTVFSVCKGTNAIGNIEAVLPTIGALRVFIRTREDVSTSRTFRVPVSGVA